MKPVWPRLCASAARADFQPEVLNRGIEQVADILRGRAGQIEREMRQEMRDQIGLMRAQPVSLAAAEERALRVRRSPVIVRRRWTTGCGAHRSV
jgi:hypothetical protein